MKRAILFLTVLLLICGFASAAGTAGTSEGEPYTIQAYFPGDTPIDFDLVLEEAEKQAAADGINVDLEFIFFPWSDYADKIMTKMTAGEDFDLHLNAPWMHMQQLIASEAIQEMGRNQAEDWEIEAQLMDALRMSFRPEFLNRIDETVVFHTLTKENLAGIVDIQVGELSARLASRKITVTVTDSARLLVSELGYDPTFGARPLKRLIQQKLENGLAGRIIAGEVTDGDHVTISAEGKTFTFDVER